MVNADRVKRKLPSLLLRSDSLKHISGFKGSVEKALSKRQTRNTLTVNNHHFTINLLREKMRLYKFLKKKEHLEGFRKNGSIWISTLTYLNENFDDTEGRKRRNWAPDKNDLVITKKELSKQTSMFQVPEQCQNVIGVEAGGKFSIYNQYKDDVFVFCASTKLDLDYWTSRGYKYHYVIEKPERFLKLLWRNLNEKLDFGLKLPYYHSEVQYTPNKDETKENNLTELSEPSLTLLDLCFTKKETFRKESEYRAMFCPKKPFEIKSQLIACPELRKCCR